MEKWYPSRWGKDDEIGALNWINKEKIVSAARLARKGNIYNLSHNLEYGIPVHWYHGQFVYSTFRRHADGVKLFNTKNKFGGMNTRLELADHTGTHLDGINHVSIGNRVYNGHRSEEIMGTFGTSRLGMENTPPVFTRGVMVDIASLKGKEVLDSGYVITEAELKSALMTTRTTIGKGDAFLIATGWSKYWMKDNARYAGPCPGIGMDAGRWLAEQGVALVGSDTWNVEVEPAEDKRESAPVHQYMLTMNGIRFIENLKLESLRLDKVYEFLFVCLPLKLKGGAGSPVTPIAVV